MPARPAHPGLTGMREEEPRAGRLRHAGMAGGGKER